MKILGKTVTVILLLALFVGLCVLLYPAVSRYWNSKVQSRAVADYSGAVSGMTKQEYAAAFSEATAYNEALAALDFPLLQYDSLEGYEDILDRDGTGVMGYLTIEKLQLELPVYHGTEAEVLNRGAGHVEGTSLPVGGSGTHCVLSAHRGLPTAVLFTHLDKMEIGDIFTVTVLGEVLTYEVDSVRVVEPDEVETLSVVPGKDYMTLVTCTPYGINTHRLLVRGERIETVDKSPRYISAEAYVVDKLIVSAAVALPLIFLLIMIVLFTPGGRRREDFEDIL